MKISVVTVCRNNAATLESCLSSVENQTRPHEHIIVDGASDDGTPSLIAAYATRRNEAHTDNPDVRWISEPDAGIYDAMNKGIGIAAGDVIGTLNADDRYADPHVLQRVSDAFEDDEIQATYGDLVFVANGSIRTPPQPDTKATPLAERVVRTWKAGTYSKRSFYNGWMPPHPTFFVRRSAYEHYGLFRLDMGSSADYELMLRLLLGHGVRCAYIPSVLVRMSVGGVSTRSLRNRLRAHANDWKAWFVNGMCPMPWTVPMKPLRKIGQWRPCAKA